MSSIFWPGAEICCRETGSDGEPVLMQGGACSLFWCTLPVGPTFKDQQKLHLGGQVPLSSLDDMVLTSLAVDTCVGTESPDRQQTVTPTETFGVVANQSFILDPKLTITTAKEGTPN